MVEAAPYRLRLSDDTKAVSQENELLGNSSTRVPFGGSMLAEFCRGKAHKRLFRITSAWGATIVKMLGIMIINTKLKNELLGK